MTIQKKPNFIFFGTPEFATDVLKGLMDRGFVPSAVVCNPDRPIGRKKIITPPAIKLLVLERLAQNPALTIEILQPEALDDACIEKLRSFNPDVFIIAAFAKLIKQDVLDIPKYGSIGVHPSLLPLYRGASPLQTTLINGEKTTGVTLFLVDVKMDHGPIIAQETIEVGSMDCAMLSKKLAELGSKLIAHTVTDFIAGKITPAEQAHDKATFTKKFATEDAFIDIHDIERARIEGGSIAQALECKIRGLNPEPGTWTMASSLGDMQFGQEKRVKILKAALSTDGKLIIQKIHIDGRSPIDICERNN